MPRFFATLSSRLAWLTLAFALAIPSIAKAHRIPPNEYSYPYTEPFLATVSHALMKPTTDAMKVEKIRFYADRGRFDFGFYNGSPDRPLVLLLHGQGAEYYSDASKYLAEVFFKAGYSVASFSSVMHWSFMLHASESGYTGYTPDDAANLLQVLSSSVAHLEKKYHRRFPSLILVGTSLGGLDAAYVSKLDSERKVLGLDRTILLNPPVDVLHGIHTLDSLYDVADQWTPEQKLCVETRGLALLGKAKLENKGDGREFEHLEKKVRLTPDEIKFMVGRNFRPELRKAILASQRVRDRGVLKGPASNPLNWPERWIEAGRFSFYDYMTEILLPYWAERHGQEPDLPTLNRQAGLEGIADYLANNPRIFMMHNADDFLLRESDPDFLERTFGDRLLLYPYGGHTGNHWYPRNRSELLELVSKPLHSPIPVPEAANALF